MDFMAILEHPLFMYLSTAVLDIVTVCVLFKRTGKIIKKPTATVVNEDLHKLVEYHRKTADELEKMEN